jgi:hypothetical protein
MRLWVTVGQDPADVVDDLLAADRRRPKVAGRLGQEADQGW